MATFFVLLATAAEARGQSDSAATRWPDIGSRVRVWTASGGPVTGDLVNVSGDTLAIRTARQLSPKMPHIPAGKVTFVPGSAVVRIEVSRGRTFQGERAVAGAALGAAAGLAVAAAANASADVMFGAAAGPGVEYGEAMVLGAIVGAAIGASTPGDRWEDAQTSPPPFAPQVQRVKLRLTPRFR